MNREDIIFINILTKNIILEKDRNTLLSEIISLREENEMLREQLKRKNK